MQSAAPPEMRWKVGDDLCDCTFQRIGDWTNPYIGKTLRVRLCCLWKELAKNYPDLVEMIPFYYDQNNDVYLPKPLPWDSDGMDMPRDIWYRQLETQTGLSLQEIRNAYWNKEPPKRVAKRSRNGSHGDGAATAPDHSGAERGNLALETGTLRVLFQ